MDTHRTSIIGRERELGALERALAAARSGAGRVVLLTGEDGVGKSRLAAEVAERAAARGMRVMRGRASAIGLRVPCRPLTEALLELSRDRRLGPEAAGLCGTALAGLTALREPGPSRDATSCASSLVVLGEAVLRAVAEAGRTGGCLVVLEDLHDADPGTPALVEFLADNIAREPVTLLLTLRDEPCQALELARALARRGSGTLIGLDRLDRSEVRALIAGQLSSGTEELPEGLVDRIWEQSDGNPWAAQELLTHLVDEGLLGYDADGWRLSGRPCAASVPDALVAGVARRVDRLGPRGRELLAAAAVVGTRFPAPVVQAATGMADDEALGHLHAALAGGLIGAAEPAPDWFTFRHPLTARALLRTLAPKEQARIARDCAGAVADLHPQLPADWCLVAARLWETAGERDTAAGLYARAGSRALAHGAAVDAAEALDRARALLAGQDTAAAGASSDPRHVPLYAHVLDSLLAALTEAGESERAWDLAGAVDGVCPAAAGPERAAALHVRLARAASVTGRTDEARAQLSEGRRLLGPEGEAEGAVDAAGAALALQSGAVSAREEERARKAAAAAERAGNPEAACQAWDVLGVLARTRDVAESTGCFDRVRTIAERHGMPFWRLRALFRLGGDDWLTEGDVARLEHARREAARLGAGDIGGAAEADLALWLVLSGRFGTAAQLIDACWTRGAGQRDADRARHLLAADAVLAAHRGKRARMEQAVAEFHRWDGDRSPLATLTTGLARTFCALLEEDRPRAHQELARIAAPGAVGAGHPLDGRHGLLHLLDALSEDDDEDEGESTWTAGAPTWGEEGTTPTGKGNDEAPLAQLRWNRHFVLLARAVRLGRSGHGDEAAAVMGAAHNVAAPFPVAYHLGLRLVAEAAHRDGWGEPTVWLHRAEEFFHQASVPAVAGACRGLLRKNGVPVRQRRRGADLVPRPLRQLGVTVREYEVFRLMAPRPANRDIADRLYISPRTVEKHVASLILKTGRPSRAALSELASTVLLDDAADEG
ncbi:helix-turn-helix transcriptional regulator [Streptomyces kanamyceticus]|uniref:LuxR family transcriptional regulator n=1 Tax=Streptomyces kanamyceticus TaxID=1967 RepID=A0A5J6GQ74_STRKN|nr:LuxR family transcriptional regulator [Streptomyces kanamyceticus]QEU96572.1 LuxR family transcriptional regulator [Streptomyces kanamyceticus]